MHNKHDQTYITKAPSQTEQMLSSISLVLRRCRSVFTSIYIMSWDYSSMPQLQRRFIRTAVEVRAWMIITFHINNGYGQLSQLISVSKRCSLDNDQAYHMM